MRAAILEAESLLAIHEIEPDAITKPDQVLLEVRSCTVCATDLKWYTGIRAHPVPSRFGHEVAGVVSAVGSDATRWRPGDRVFSRSVNGGFADYCLADAAMLAPLPNSVGFEEGAIAQLLPIAVSAAEKSIRPGDTVYVSGAGAAGLLVTQVARAYGEVRLTPLLTHVRPLAAIQQAFAYCLEHRAELIKMAIVP
ncbi:MAG: alcohol dehydrogenase catalytic domain-containing protein [Armatimonadota bacterium]